MIEAICEIMNGVVQEVDTLLIIITPSIVIVVTYFYMAIHFSKFVKKNQDSIKEYGGLFSIILSLLIGIASFCFAKFILSAAGGFGYIIIAAAIPAGIQKSIEITKKIIVKKPV